MFIVPCFPYVPLRRSACFGWFANAHIFRSNGARINKGLLGYKYLAPPLERNGIHLLHLKLEFTKSNSTYKGIAMKKITLFISLAAASTFFAACGAPAANTEQIMQT